MGIDSAQEWFKDSNCGRIFPIKTQFMPSYWTLLIDSNEWSQPMFKGSELQPEMFANRADLFETVITWSLYHLHV